MILYTDEARASWKKTAGELRSKIVSGAEMSYLDAKNLCQILGMFYDYVDKEAQGTLDTPDTAS